MKEELTKHRSYAIDQDVALMLDVLWMKTGKNKSQIVNECIRKTYSLYNSKSLY